MAAALGGMVSRPAPEPEPEPAPAATAAKTARETPPEARQAAPKRRAAPKPKKKPRAQPAPTQTPSARGEEGGGHRATGIGYIKADGTEMVRTVLMVTREERRRLKLMALEAGVSPSDYVRKALGFV